MLRLTRHLLFLIALTPLITLNLPFGTIVWKLFFLRTVIELAVICFCIYILRGRDAQTLPWRHPIVLMLGAYTLSLVISAMGAISPYRAVWGNLERGEGLVTWFHYIAFFLLAILAWKKDDWFKMFRLSLLVGLPLMGYGALQYFGITYFPPFRIALSDRAISLVGNPAFFATHLIFLIILASLTRLHARQTGSKIWEYVAVTAMILAIPVIFMTGTRGAMLGVGIGSVAALGYVFGANIRKKEKGERRKAIGAGAALLVLFAGAIFFVATREAPAWKIIPSAERVSSLLTRGIEGTSAEDRLTVWRMSFEAWKEQPVFGWGPENYLPVFVKYFNPRLDRGMESWFDRSHNNLIDIAVMQGLVGLIAYVGFIGAIIWFAVGRSKNEPRTTFATDVVHSKAAMNTLPFTTSPIFSEKVVRGELLARAKPYLLGGLIAYVIQNLFLFDQPLSYLYLMILAGFLIASGTQNEEQRTPADAEALAGREDKGQRTKNKRVTRGFAIGTAALAAYAIYAWNVTPFRQIQYVEAAKKTPNQEEVIKLLQKGFYPYNFAQHDLRANIIDHEYGFQPEIFAHPGFTELSSYLLESIREVRREDSSDPRMLIREIQVLTLQSQLKPELLSEVEKVAREGVELAPRKPVFYYKLSLALANEGKYEEAKRVAEKGVDLYPESPRSRFQLGLVLAMGGDKYHEEAVKAFKKFEELDPTMGLARGDINNYILVYMIWKDNAKVADIILKTVSRGGGQEIQLPYFKTALAYFMEKEMKEEFLAIARFMVPVFPDIAEDLQIYIKLAEEEKWEIIKNI